MNAGGGGAGAGGEGGRISNVCAGMQLVTVSNPVLEAGGDDTWSPGEVATLTVTLTSPADNVDYPGIVVSHATNGVTPNPAENWLFGLIAGEPTPIGVDFVAGASVPPTTVVFDVQVATLNERCAGLDSLTFEVEIK